MTPRDRLAQDLAALLPSCTITADGSCRIRVSLPGFGVVFLAVSRFGKRVDVCDREGLAHEERMWYDRRVLTGTDAREIIFNATRTRLWSRHSATLAELTTLAELGFADKVPSLIDEAVARLGAERARKAEESARLWQELDAKLKAIESIDALLSDEQDAYRALLEVTV